MAYRHTRRDFVKTASATVAGGAALGGGLLGAHDPEDGSAYDRTLHERWVALGAVPNAQGMLVLTVVARYRSDPERTARIIPPPLEPDPSGEVLLDWVVMIPEPGKVDTFMPGPTYAESDIFVSVMDEGHRGRVLRDFESVDEARYLSPRMDGRWMGSFDYNLPGAKSPFHTFLVNDLEVTSKSST
jgi:hypothetical protein